MCERVAWALGPDPRSSCGRVSDQLQSRYVYCLASGPTVEYSTQFSIFFPYSRDDRMILSAANDGTVRVFKNN